MNRDERMEKIYKYWLHNKITHSLERKFSAQNFPMTCSLLPNWLLLKVRHTKTTSSRHFIHENFVLSKREFSRVLHVSRTTKNPRRLYYIFYSLLRSTHTSQPSESFTFYLDWPREDRKRGKLVESSATSRMDNNARRCQRCCCCCWCCCLFAPMEMLQQVQSRTEGAVLPGG